VIPDSNTQTEKEKTAQIQTYVDANRNSEFDAGEENLPNVLIAAQSNIDDMMMRTAQLTDTNASGEANLMVFILSALALIAVAVFGRARQIKNG